MAVIGVPASAPVPDDQEADLAVLNAQIRHKHRIASTNQHPMNMGAN